MEIEIPASLTEWLLDYAAETERSAEEIVECAIQNYLEGADDCAERG